MTKWIEFWALAQPVNQLRWWSLPKLQLLERIEMSKKLQEEFNQTENVKLEREDATLERWKKMQQETEERHFRMLQEQQTATNAIFMNFMQTIMQSMSHQRQAPHHAASWGSMHPQYHPAPGDLCLLHLTLIHHLHFLVTGLHSSLHNYQLPRPTL